MGQFTEVTLPVEKVAGADSWLLSKGHVEAALTQEGGHMGPVTFKLGSRRIAPYSVAPWAEETLDPSICRMLVRLRGDFFCAPFGDNKQPYNGENHPPHGESANCMWTFAGAKQNSRELVAEFLMPTTIRKGEIRKQIRILASQPIVYTRHTLSGMSGPMDLGHHAMIKFPEEPLSGLISTGPFVYGQVFPTAFENPTLKGYQSLKPGATFKSAHQVPMIDGSLADITHYPARHGFEDLVMVVSNPKQRLGWTAVCFPREGYIWFCLKDTQVLHNTVFWFSNAGRHYAPWNGRHSRVLGIEDTTSYFHYGIAESSNPNPISSQGMPTSLQLDAGKPTVVNYIQGIVAAPAGFDRVASIRAGEDRKSIILTSTGNHEINAPVEIDYLFPAK